MRGVRNLRPAVRPSRSPVVALSLSWLLAPAIAQQSPFRFAREDVLGTSCNLVVNAPDEATAHRAETAVLAEVARLATIVSTWDEHAELARLVAAQKGTPSPELATVLRLADEWRTRSDGAFEPGVVRLHTLWAEAAKTGAPPEATKLAAAIAELREPTFTFTGDQVTFRGPITLDALAKGWIVERASAVVAKTGASLVSFQIGGDTRVGKDATDVVLVDPRSPSSNGTPLRTVHVADRGVASSGGYARGYDVHAVHHSHVLDPRTGGTCDAVLGASVIAKDTATADVLATILCVLGPERGFAVLAKTEGAEAVVVTKDGVVHESKGFAALVTSPPTTAAPTPAAATTGESRAWPADWALRVDFEIKAPATEGSGRRGGWKRPYVAVWIEDAIGDPARTLCLWLEDRRWQRDLRRWTKKYPNDDHVTDTVSQATRKAGAYTLLWDGKDDDGRQRVSGTFTVCIEVVREHGSYQLIRREVELHDQPLTIELEGNDEVASAKLTFGPAVRSKTK